MSKFNLQKGDKALVRASAVVDENTFKKIGGHNPIENPVTVKKSHPHGISTDMGYFHNNNIISKA